MVNFSLEGKVAWVTGASYGIGFALATAFSEAGAKIVFNDISRELVDKGLAAYKELGIEARGYVCDVTSEEQVNALVAQIEKEVGAAWTVVLFISAMKAVHQFSFGKTLALILLTLVAMILVLFLLVLLLTLFQQVLIFIFTIYTELSYRLRV